MRPLLAAALAGPLLLLGACAGGREAVGIPAPAHPSPVAAAADPVLAGVPGRVAAAGTVRYRMVMALELPDEGARTVVMTGATDSINDRMTVDADLTAFTPELGHLELIVDGGERWVRLGGEGPWTHGDSSAPAPALDGLTDPATLVELLGSVSGDPESLGTDSVDGEPVSGWRAVAVEPEGEVPVEVWLDSAGLPRRLVAGMDALLGMSGDPGSATMTVELFDYGRPVEVTPPPEEETIG